MASNDGPPLENIDVPLELMQRVGLLDDPVTSPYFRRDEVPLTTDEKITLLAGVGLLTERQAAAYVHRRIEDHSRDRSAEAIGIAPSTLDDYLRHAEDKIAMAEMTERVVDILETA